jgi:hypothetical protein
MSVDDWQWALAGLLLYHSIVLRLRVRALEAHAGERGWVARWL